ncbi:hypothetical protein AQZ52_01760 [Novosphingobium fuchskuhlense]|uniref:Calcium-binding protein n=1 Tax=Novosphingobium fuchskuhlense TaxID=1117702 RepID=A0A117UZI1_9SPHN|nr:calcium-binding protein [Novosphingobium fuchskuhlense]KUR73718.1 hypothetical protein AQZ52_01760 [Novosphingobium fuchskuhlense]
MVKLNTSWGGNFQLSQFKVATYFSAGLEPKITHGDLTIGTETFPDVASFRVMIPLSDIVTEPYDFHFGGTGLAFASGTSALAAGTISALHVTWGDYASEAYTLSGLSLTAADIAAAQKSSNPDATLAARIFSGNDDIELGHNADVANGYAGDDRLSGGGGYDTLYGGAGNDKLYGGPGHDDLYDVEGNNLFHGGAEYDTVHFVGARAGVTVNLALTRAQATGIGSDTLVLVENIEGSAFGDRFTGTDGSNEFRGLAGNDRLDGRAGDDFLVGGKGSDILIGGTGADMFGFSDIRTGIDTIVDMRAGQGDTIRLSRSAFVGMSNGALKADQFYAADGATQAHDASDRIVYDTATGALYFDADGAGGQAAVQFAIVGNDHHPLLDFSLFSVVPPFFF